MRAISGCTQQSIRQLPTYDVQANSRTSGVPSVLTPHTPKHGLPPRMRGGLSSPTDDHLKVVWSISTHLESLYMNSFHQYDSQLQVPCVRGGSLSGPLVRGEKSQVFCMRSSSCCKMSPHNRLLTPAFAKHPVSLCHWLLRRFLMRARLTDRDLPVGNVVCAGLQPLGTGDRGDRISVFMD